MKKLFTIALAALFVFGGCKKGGDEEEQQITIPDESEQIQTAFADEETTGGFTFTAKSDWTATVQETTTTRIEPVNPAWIRLINNQIEMYSGRAGTFTFVVALDPNYSGVTRKATITIRANGEGASYVRITVTQQGTTQTGTVPVEYGKFTVNGRSVGITGGEMHYYGDEYSKSAENVFVGFSSQEEFPDVNGDGVFDIETDFWVALDMLVPDGKDRLVAGTYTFANSHEPFTFTTDRKASGAVDAENEKWLEMTGGTVKVSVSGTGTAAVYTVAVDCTLTGGGKVRGTYRGTLDWSDER